MRRRLRQIADRLFWRLGLVRRAHYSRAYAAAAINRLTADWITQSKTADAEIRSSLKTLRARCRELANNNDYVRKFLAMVVANVVGPNGIILQAKVRRADGSVDRPRNQALEAAWTRWGQKEHCDWLRESSLQELLTVAVQSIPRDGEILIRKIRGADNPFGFAIQLLEPDHLDELYDDTLPDGGRIRMSIEYDALGRRRAYHLLTAHPGDDSFPIAHQPFRERIPASDMLHVFVRTRSSQSRGVPWLHTAMTRLNMLGGYEEAELVAARVGACKMGFFTSKDGAGFTGDDKTAKGDLITEAEPGLFGQLPEGMELTSYDPQHPVGNYPAYTKSVLRGIASGLLVSYNGLASDLEGVNYSSIRQGVMDERDMWRIIQAWIKETVCRELYLDWLRMAMLTGQVAAPPAEFEALSAHRWQCRGWGWVDPLKDIEASIRAIEQGLKTRTQVAAEQGHDLEDLYAQLAEEATLAKAYGLTFPTAAATPAAPPAETDEDAEQDDEKETDEDDARLLALGSSRNGHHRNGGAHG